MFIWIILIIIAVFGAIYLDSGFEAARDIIVEIWRELAAQDTVAPKDPPGETTKK